MSVVVKAFSFDENKEVIGEQTLEVNVAEGTTSSIYFDMGYLPQLEKDQRFFVAEQECVVKNITTLLGIKLVEYEPC